VDDIEDYDAEDEYDPMEFAKAEIPAWQRRICAGSKELAQEETEADQLAARGDTLMVDFDWRQPSMDHRKRRALIEDLRTRLTTDEFKTLLGCLRSELGYGPELLEDTMRQIRDHPVSSEAKARRTEELQAEADRLRQEEAENLGLV
jgi:hypothetical protein